jgi:hypothetical protein
MRQGKGCDMPRGNVVGREQESKQYKTKSEHRERESDWLAFPNVDKFPDSATAVRRQKRQGEHTEQVCVNVYFPLERKRKKETRDPPRSASDREEADARVGRGRERSSREQQRSRRRRRRRGGRIY